MFVLYCGCGLGWWLLVRWFGLRCLVFVGLPLVLYLLLVLLMCCCSATGIATLDVGWQLVFSMLFWWLLFLFCCLLLFGVLAVFAGLSRRGVCFAWVFGLRCRFGCCLLIVLYCCCYW